MSRQLDNILGYSVVIIASLVVASLVFIISWKTFAYGPIFTLSEGTMQARSAKLSYKGLIWKTHQGWIPLGMDSEGMLKKWNFTVTNGNPAVLECLRGSRNVTLYYKDYIGMPFRMGSSHQVYDCRIAK